MLAVLREILKEINRKHYFRNPISWQKPWGKRSTQLNSLRDKPANTFAKDLYSDMAKALIQQVAIPKSIIIETENLSWVEIATKEQEAQVEASRNEDS